MHYQLELDIKTLMEELSLDEAALARELGVNLVHVRRLVDDQWSSINRHDLQALMCWAHRHGKEILTVTPNPVWKTFPGNKVLVFRGQDDSGNPLPSDAQVEATLVGMLKDEGCQVQIVQDGDAYDYPRVVKAMNESNCIFIGSPKHNLASENALAALLNVAPLDESAENQRKSFFRFVWAAKPRRASAFGEVQRGSDLVGIRVYAREGKKMPGGHLLPVDYHASPGVSFPVKQTVRSETAPLMSASAET